MRLTASDFYTYLRPAKCGLRVFLRQQKVKEAPPSPYEEVMLRLGKRHERDHLMTFPSVADLSSGKRDERAKRTLEAVRTGAPVIYQAVLQATASLDDTECEVLGEPDFLIERSGQYAIRDSKMARRITQSDHPEILRQLEIYGWLYEETFGKPPSSLQVHCGTGEIVRFPYYGGKAALELLRRILQLRQAESEPFDPVGWSKCDRCVFKGRCWPRAEKRRDVAIVPKVDQGLVRALRDQGIETLDELLDAFDAASLADIKRPIGERSQRVGKKAHKIMSMAQALVTGKEILLKAPEIPEYQNYVMFDLEGIPPQFDESGRIYLWGLQPFGDKPGEYYAATSGFGPDFDLEGWEGFLAKAETIFDQYGDLPFVHWGSYEKTQIAAYANRYGDRDGIASRVHRNLLNILPITERSLALPVPSYSLKVVEKHIGFKRTLGEYGGDWAMARYAKATEMEDKTKQAEVMDELLTYNREDLEATWAVFNWLRAKSAK